MAQTSDKAGQTFAHYWKQNLRAWGMWYRQSPGFFASTLLSSAGGGLAPYLTIWLSAQIISELAGGRDARRLAFWAALTVGVTALLALANGALNRWQEYERSRLSAVRFRPLADKMLTLDYAQMDCQEVQDLYSQIGQNDNWGGYGLYQTLQLFPYFCKGAVQVLGGIGFTLPLFLTDLPADSPLSFLNSPLALVAVLTAMVLVVVLSSLCDGKATLMLTKEAETFTFGNRIFGFYGFRLVGDRKRAGDLRIYQQLKNVGTPLLSDPASLPFFPGSSVSKLSKGRVGLLFGLCQSLTAVMTCAVYLFVCLKSWGGAFDVGLVARYVGSATQLFGGISLLLQTLSKVRVNGNFLDTTFRFLDLPNPMYQGSLTTEKRADRNYQVEFRDVSFRYPGSDRWALRHVNIRFRIGSRLAVVGPNGSGKNHLHQAASAASTTPPRGKSCSMASTSANTGTTSTSRSSRWCSRTSSCWRCLWAKTCRCRRLRPRPGRTLPAGRGLRGPAGRHAPRPGHLPLQGPGQGRGGNLGRRGPENRHRPGALQGRALPGAGRTHCRPGPPSPEAEVYASFDAIAGDKTAIYISHRCPAASSATPSRCLTAAPSSRPAARRAGGRRNGALPQTVAGPGPILYPVSRGSGRFCGPLPCTKRTQLRLCPFFAPGPDKSTKYRDAFLWIA